MPRRKTHEEFVRQVYDLRGEDYVILTKYQGSKKKIRVLHTTCGSEYETRADGLLHGYECKACVYKKMTKTHDEYKKQVEEIHNKEYEVVSQYMGAHEKVDILHKTCGRIRSVDANSVLQGKKCIDCVNEGRAKTQEDFEREVYERVGDEYKVTGNYVLAIEPIEFLHNDESCGLTFSSTPNSFLSGGTRCPHCAFSKGEVNIRRVLDNMGITYESEKEFSDLFNIRNLRFDFYIPDYNLLIEFDGEQHYRPVELFGGLDYLRKVQLNDAKKDEYCLKNNINLLRIPYTELHNEKAIIDETLHSLEYIMFYAREGCLA